MIPRQETITIVLNLYVRIPEALIGQVVPSLYLPQLRLTGNAAPLLVAKRACWFGT